MTLHCGDLTDAQWEKLKPLLPPQQAATGRPAEDHRRMINGVLWIRRTGGLVGASSTTQPPSQWQPYKPASTQPQRPCDACRRHSVKSCAPDGPYTVLGLGVGCFNGVSQPSEAVNTRNQNILEAPILQLIEHP